MKTRTWPLLALAFALMIGAFLGGGLVLYRDYRRIYQEVDTAQRQYRESNALLEAIRSDLYSTAILVRDYLLQTESSGDRPGVEDIKAARESLFSHLDQLEKVLEAFDYPKLPQIRSLAQKYFDQRESIFHWSPAEVRERGAHFLAKEVLPTRKALLSMASEVADLSEQRLESRQNAVRDLQRQAEMNLRWVAGFVLLFGAFVAVSVVTRTRSLERTSEEYREKLRRLSNSLTSAQEAERTAISRELHDEIGQLITGLKIELQNMEETRDGSGFAEHLRRARGMAEETLRSVRHLATGLRPAVLDQLGLEPALRWQAREHARATGKQVTVEVNGDLDELPEAYRTCVYRAVQEALTNCARHANAKFIRVAISNGPEGLTAEVRDDGCGFRTGLPRNGLGLLGMEERVSELGGHLRVISRPQHGTVIRLELPASQGVST